MPITESIKIEVREASTFSPLPENVYQVELLDVSSEKRPTYDTRNKPDPEKEYEQILNFQFTLLGGKEKDGSSLRGRNVWQNFVPTYLYISSKNGKNKLYQIVESLLGRELTLPEEAEMDEIFINKLVGKQCRVGIKNKTSGDKTFSNIDTYFSSEQDMVSLTEEEKDKATVKNDKKVDEHDEINPEDIPFGK